MEEGNQFFFEPFLLDIADRRLWNGEQAVKLTSLAFNLLSYFVKNSRRLLTKDELLRAISQPESLDATLYGLVKEVRKALGDDQHKPQFIETVHREGYRFIATVQKDKGRKSTDRHSPGSAVDNARPPEQQPQPICDTWQISPGFVGRDAELIKIHKLLGEAFAGERRIIFLTGEPGIGKTATVEAFLTRLPVDTELWVGRGQCIDHHGAGEAYLPILDAFGQLCRSPRGQRISELLALHAPTWLVQMPTLLNTSDLDALQRKTHGATRERMLREMADALEALTRETPLVLWLEDLHWSDYATLDLLSFLARRRQAARLVVVGTYRPVEVIMREHPLKTVKQDLQLQDRCVELSLGFLTEAAVREYLSVKFPANQFPPALSRILHRRTDGSPLFMVNVVEEWVTRGVLQTHEGCWGLTTALEELEKGAPQNLRQMIEQQVARLHPHVQRMLEAASVVGDEFSAAAVAAGAGEDTINVEEQYAALVSQDHLVQARGTDEWPDGTITARYGFIHALYREVIYGKITPARRAQFHQRIGERLEQGYAAATSEIAPQLALHFEQARDSARAIHYLQQAATNAARRSAHHEEIAHLTKALTLLKARPDGLERTRQELDLQTALGVPLMVTKGYADVEVEKVFAKARRLCQEIGETPQLFPVLWGLCAFYTVRGECRTGWEIAAELVQLAQSAQNPALLIMASVARGGTSLWMGDFTAAQELLEQGASLYRAQQGHSLPTHLGYDPGIACLSYGALALWGLGYSEQAQAKVQEALFLAQESNNPYTLVHTQAWAAVFYQHCRDVQTTQTLSEAVITLSAQHGFPFWTAMGNVLWGWALTEQGKIEEGILRMQQGIDEHGATGAGWGQSYYPVLLAEAYGKALQPNEGLRVLAESPAPQKHLEEHWWEAEKHRLKGELSLQSVVCGVRFKTQKRSESDAQSLEAAAAESFHQALTLAQSQNAKMLELRAAMSLSRLWRGQHKKQKAKQILMKIYRRFSEGTQTRDLLEAEMLLAEYNH